MISSKSGKRIGKIFVELIQSIKIWTNELENFSTNPEIRCGWDATEIHKSAYKMKRIFHLFVENT